MSDMILGAIILVVAVLAVRCYCGRKYGVAGGCGYDSCCSCPNSKDCASKR